MRIFILTNTRPHTGGVTTYINLISHGLQNLGHEVNIINMFGCFKKQIIRQKVVERSENWLKNSGTRVLILMFLTRIITAWHVWFACLNKKCDFFLCQDTNTAHVAKWMRKIFKIPILLAVHASLSATLVTQNKISPNCWQYKKIKKLEKESFKIADKILVMSKYVKNYVKSAIGETDKISVLPSPIDKNLFKKDLAARNEWRKKYNLDNKFVMLFAGRLAKIKGSEYPIQILKELNLKNVELIYVGRGPDENILKDKVRELNLEKQVKFLGRVNFEKMPAIYNMADVCLITSITDAGMQEALSLTALEAMACGLPSIVFKSGGLVENIKHGENGFLVQEKDVETMAKYVKQIYQDKKLAQEMAKGAEKLAQNFDIKKTAEKIIDIYQKI